MYPIQAHTVNLVLQYICPPSQLDQPLPPHLLSKALLQRHHFLSIFPNDSQAYLCWPSPQNDKAVEHLESFAAPELEDGFAVRYTSDPEYTHAHVDITNGQKISGARLIFQWDDVDGWKYHDLQLMPFPAASYPTIGQASSATLPSQISTNMGGSYGSYNRRDDDIDDDPYWNAYGAHEDSLSPLQSSSVKSTIAQEGTEDAYWAQYASVQGTADSTVPSPLPIKNHTLHPAHDRHRYTSHDEPLAIPLSAIHSRSRFSNLGPPSPNTLTNLLNIISPRRDNFPSPLSEPDSETALDSVSPFSVLDQPDTVTPLSVDGDQFAEMSVPKPISIQKVPILTVNHSEELENDDEGDKLLRETIRGIHSLWKAGRRKQGVSQSNKTNDEHFLRIVREVIN